MRDKQRRRFHRNPVLGLRDRARLRARSTSEHTRYERRTEGVTAGTQRFHLVQLDKEGTATISGMVAVFIEAEGSREQFFPSPARTSVRIEGLTSAADVVDALGRVVARAVLGEARTVSAWAPGVYVVIATEPQRFVVTR